MSSQTDRIVNKDIILFALYELGGMTEPKHTEDIAHQVFKYPLGRQKYKWERYDYPDKERIARELRWLKSWKGKSYVKGHVNIGARKDRIDGWLLTSDGVERIKNIEEEIRKVLSTDTGSQSVWEVERVRKRITSTNCYRTYGEDSELANASDQDFTDMLYCLPDAPIEKIRSAFDSLLAEAIAVEASDLVEFLEAAKKRFRRLID